MGIIEIIELIVLFIVVYILFIIISFLVIDNNLSPGKLPPKELFTPLWRVLLNALITAFVWIVAFITFLWVVWLILKVIPIFGPLIIATVPPFRQFERAGIFNLWSDIIIGIFTVDFPRIVKGFVKFIHRSGKYIVQKATKKYVKKPKEPVVLLENSNPTNNNKPKEENKEVQKDAAQIKQEKIEEQGVDATQESTFTAEQLQAVEDKIQMCITEKTLPEYDTMSFIEKLQVRVLNNSAAVTCKAGSVGDFMKMKSTT